MLICTTPANGKHTCSMWTGGCPERNFTVTVSPTCPGRLPLSILTAIIALLPHIPESPRKHNLTLFTIPPLSHSSSASNRIIHAKDHASVQLNIVDVDPKTGRMLETSKVYAICGEIRRMGESDDCIARLAKKDGVLSKAY